MQNRLTSPVFWASLAAQVVSILVLTGALDIARQDVINGLIAAALQVLVAFGLLNNPTNPEGF